MWKRLRLVWDILSTATTVFAVVKWLGPKGMAIAALASAFAAVLWYVF